MTALRVAIVGFGKIARDQHVPAIAATDGVTLAAVASPSLAAGPAAFRNAGGVAARRSADRCRCCVHAAAGAARAGGGGARGRQACDAGKAAGREPPAKRECQVANSVRPARDAAAIRESSSLTLAPGGFSSITCLPAASAAAACERRTCGGVHTATASIGGPRATTPPALRNAAGPAARCWGLATAASVTPSVAAMAGTC